MRDAFVSRLTALAKKNSNIILLTADLGFGIFDDFSTLLPNQFLNVGVAEQNMMGVATGLALEGKTVFTYSIGNFPSLRCLEQIRNDICYHNADVKIIGMGAGFSYGALGMSHHATEDISILRSLPEMKIVVPCDDWEAGEATEALANTPGPFYLRLDKTSAGFTNYPNEIFDLTKSRQLRSGSDITFIGSGGIVLLLLQAQEKLAEQGVQCRVISMHTLSPVDQTTILDAVQNTGGIITVEEQVLNGGLGSIVAEVCMDKGIMPKHFHRIGIRNVFSSIVGSQDYLRKACGLDLNSIVDVARSVASHLAS
jgi:transketolase